MSMQRAYALPVAFTLLLGVLCVLALLPGQAHAALTFAATDISSDGAFTLTFEGATADASETIFAVTDPTADRTITFSDQSGTPILSTGGVADAADAITGGASLFLFEGATADGFETTLTVADATADSTATVPNQTGTFLLSTAAQDAANSAKGVANGFEFEGATANGFELTLAAFDATADATVTIPGSTGTILLSTAAQDAANSIKGVANGFEFEGTGADAGEVTLTVTDPGTSDFTITFPAVTGAPILSTGGIADTAHSISGGSSLFLFEGATADASETTITVTDPTADRTVTIPDATGTVDIPRISAKTGAYTVTAGDTGTTFTNAGAGGSVTFTLPSAAAALQYTFIRVAAQNVVVDAAGGAQIMNLTNAANDSITSDTTGESITLVSDGTNWYAVSCYTEFPIAGAEAVKLPCQGADANEGWVDSN